MPVFLHNGKLHAFVHVPKCGGTTIERELTERFGAVGLLDERFYATPQPRRWTKTSPQHVAWADMARLIPEAMLDQIFAVVRHPLSRFVSTYNFNARSGHVPAGMGPEEWFLMGIGAPDQLPFLSDNHLRPQVDLMPERTTIFRLESGLDKVIDWIDDAFGVSGGKIVNDGNVAPTPDPARFKVLDMPAGLKRRIEDYYGEDYARFGYDPAPPKPPTLTVPCPHRRTLASRMYTKLWARRIEHRFRRIESTLMMAASRVQARPNESRVQ